MEHYRSAKYRPSVKQFVGSLDLDFRGMHTASYLRSSLYRQYKSLLMVLKWINDGDRVLSLGAGGAFVEEYIAKVRGARVFVVDFAEAIHRNQRLYDKYFERSYSANITDSNWVPPVTDINVVLWFDNIEHLSTDPVVILKRLKGSLAKDARLFITTDNFARFRNILKLTFRRSILPMPDKLFSDFSFDNEGVHRREYTLPELKLILAQSGYDFEEVEYLWQKIKIPIYKIPFLIFEYLCPIYRPHMLIRSVARS